MGAGFSPHNSSAELTSTILAVCQLLMLSYFLPFQIGGKSTLDFLSKEKVDLSYLNDNTSIANYSKVGLQTFYELIIVHCIGGNLKIRLSDILGNGSRSYQTPHRILPDWNFSSASTASWLGTQPVQLSFPPSSWNKFCCSEQMSPSSTCRTTHRQLAS